MKKTKENTTEELNNLFSESFEKGTQSEESKSQIKTKKHKSWSIERGLESPETSLSW